jgi:hypothetical protein
VLAELMPQHINAMATLATSTALLVLVVNDVLQNFLPHHKPHLAKWL